MMRDASFSERRLSPAVRSIGENLRNLRPLLLLMVLWATAVTQAQEQATAVITVDRDTLTVGDPVAVTVHIRHPADYLFEQPELSWDEAELLHMDEPEQSSQSTILRFTVTLWAPGTYKLPPLSFTLKNDAGETITAVTDPLSLTVTSVLTNDDNELRDIRPQAALPLTSAPWWPWLLLALVAGGGGTAVWRARRSASQNDTLSIPTIRQEALSQLANLAGPDPSQPEGLAVYLTAVYHILRQFLQRAYGIPASYRTTAELARELPHTIIPAEQQGAVIELLQQMDRLRFSQQTKMMPDQNFSESARRFIQSAPLPD